MAGNPIFHEDIAKVKELQKSVIDFIPVLIQMREQVQASAKANLEHAKSMSMDKDAIIGLAKVTDELKTQNVQITKAIKDTTEASKKFSEAEKAAAELDKQRSRDKAKYLSDLAKQEAKQRDLIKTAEMEAKSIDDLSKKTSAMIALRKQMTDITGKNKDAFEKLTKEINTNQDALKKHDAEIGNHQRNVGNYSGALGKFQGQWLAVTAAIGGAIAAGAGLISFMKESINKAIQAERQNKLLLHSLNDNTEATKRMAAFRDQLSDTTVFSKADINSAITMAAAMGRSESQIRSMITAAMGLANITGVDMNTAMLQLSGTLEGTKGRLGKISAEIRNMSEEDLRAGKAIDVLNTKLGKFATEGMDTIEGRLIRVDKMWSKLKRTIGEGLTPLIGNVLTSLVGSEEDKLLNNIANLKEKIKASESYIKENNVDPKKDALINRILSGAKLELKLAEQQLYFDQKKKESTQGWLDLEAKKEESLKKTWGITNDEAKAIEDKFLKEGENLNKVTEKWNRYIETMKAAAGIQKAISDGSFVGPLTTFGQMSGAGTIGKMQSKSGTSIGETPAPDNIPAVAPGTPPNLDTGEDKWKKELDKIKAFASAAQDILGALSDWYKQDAQNQLDTVQEKYDSDLSSLDRQLSCKTISEEKYNKEKIKLEAKKKQDEIKIQKEAAEKQKNIQTIQAVINTALAVTGALSTQPVWLGIVMALLVGAMGAVEIATIQSAKFAHGGHGLLLDKSKGGILKGNSHSKGGISLGDIGEAEGGEYFGIVNKSATEKYRNTLPILFDSINQGKFENMFARKGSNVVVNVNDKYGKEMLAEMKQAKPQTVTMDMGNYVIYQTGNYTLKVRKS